MVINNSKSFTRMISTKEGAQVASFNGTVDEKGVVSINQYIGNHEVYTANKAAIRKSFEEFENMVHAAAEKGEGK